MKIDELKQKLDAAKAGTEIHLQTARDKNDQQLVTEKIAVLTTLEVVSSWIANKESV